MLTPEQLAEMRVRCNDGYVMIYDEIEQLLDHIDQLQRERDDLRAYLKGSHSEAYRNAIIEQCAAECQNNMRGGGPMTPYDMSYDDGCEACYDAILALKGEK